MLMDKRLIMISEPREGGQFWVDVEAATKDDLMYALHIEQVFSKARGHQIFVNLDQILTKYNSM